MMITPLKTCGAGILPAVPKASRLWRGRRGCPPNSRRYGGATFKPLMGVALLCILPGWANAAELHVPTTVQAGEAFSIPVGSGQAGSGQATFYLVGPDHVVKRTVSLGSDLQIQSNDVRAAGRYQAI